MDTALHTTQWGDAGPLVVMVHGNAQGSEVGGDRHFSRQAALVGGWRVVVPDRPGHGRSPSPGRPDDAEADGKLVAELPAFAAAAGTSRLRRPTISRNSCRTSSTSSWRSS